MATQSHPKSIARIEARVSLETKAFLQKAANLEGLTLTDFIIASARAEAKRVIQQYRIIELSLEDSQVFVDAILNPPQANDALKAAVVQYQKDMSV